MIQGTGSGAGKSLIVTSLCRIFSGMGIRVAPFKAQNMALNSYITIEGGEIGRAQALQAEAAGIEPTIDMNPILLKASGELGSQVIIHGKVHSTMTAQQYYAFKKTAWEAVKESFERLSNKYDLIIIEGAGSPAEINLIEDEIVNMSVARYADAPVILVGDIDRGGVFASFYGTVGLLDGDADRIRAFIINKFRGNLEVLKPGLEMIKDRTGKPVIGVMPYVMDIGLPEEDGLSLCHGSQPRRYGSQRIIKMVVVRLQYISNFTDFDPFLYEPDVELVYSDNPSDIEHADIVIVPGTKNTLKDLNFLKERQLDEALKMAYKKGVQIIGICGGYQMLGKRISDPHCIESDYKEVDGIGLLNIETIFQDTKITSQVEAEIAHSSWLMAHNNKNHTLSAMNYQPLRGYEIHMGQSTGDTGLFRVSRISHGASRTCISDGSINGNAWGTYIHGIFDNDLFRRWCINIARQKRGLPPIGCRVRYAEIKDSAIQRVAEIVKERIDIDFIKRLIGI